MQEVVDFEVAHAIGDSEFLALESALHVLCCHHVNLYVETLPNALMFPSYMAMLAVINGGANMLMGVIFKLLEKNKDVTYELDEFFKSMHKKLEKKTTILRKYNDFKYLNLEVYAEVLEFAAGKIAGSMSGIESKKTMKSLKTLNISMKPTDIQQSLKNIGYNVKEAPYRKVYQFVRACFILASRSSIVFNSHMKYLGGDFLTLKVDRTELGNAQSRRGAVALDEGFYENVLNDMIVNSNKVFRYLITKGKMGLNHALYLKKISLATTIQEMSTHINNPAMNSGQTAIAVNIELENDKSRLGKRKVEIQSQLKRLFNKKKNNEVMNILEEVFEKNIEYLDEVVVGKDFRLYSSNQTHVDAVDKKRWEHQASVVPKVEVLYKNVNPAMPLGKKLMCLFKFVYEVNVTLIDKK